MLSLPKILLVLAVVAVVVLLSKSFRGRGGKDDNGDAGQNDAAAENESDTKALDLIPCAVCGDFMAADSQGCDRSDCPYPS